MTGVGSAYFFKVLLLRLSNGECCCLQKNEQHRHEEKYFQKFHFHFPLSLEDPTGSVGLVCGSSTTQHYRHVPLFCSIFASEQCPKGNIKIRKSNKTGVLEHSIIHIGQQQQQQNK
jgi:hypothetical protein